MRAHTLQWKKEELSALKEKMKSYPVVALIDLTGVDAHHFQVLRKKLAGKAWVHVSKKRVLQRALKEAGFDAAKLDAVGKTQLGIILSTLNPFELYATLKKNRSKAPAKPGMIADKDIVIPQGDTGLPPGPDLADLKAAGIPAQLQGPSIKLAKDHVLVKKGEKVSVLQAKALSKLDIKPVEIAIKFKVAWEGDQAFEGDVLDIDTDKMFAQFALAHQQAVALSMEAGILNAYTIEPLLQKAYRSAKALALEANVLTPETVGEILAKGQRTAQELEKEMKAHPPAPAPAPA